MEKDDQDKINAFLGNAYELSFHADADGIVRIPNIGSNQKVFYGMGRKYHDYPVRIVCARYFTTWADKDCDLSSRPAFTHVELVLACVDCPGQTKDGIWEYLDYISESEQVFWEVKYDLRVDADVVLLNRLISIADPQWDGELWVNEGYRFNIVKPNIAGKAIGVTVLKNVDAQIVSYFPVTEAINVPLLAFNWGDGVRAYRRESDEDNSE